MTSFSSESVVDWAIVIPGSPFEAQRGKGTHSAKATLLREMVCLPLAMKHRSAGNDMIHGI
jgi:hypothetical protein